jgi:hypothetical protein
MTLDNQTRGQTPSQTPSPQRPRRGAARLVVFAMLVGIGWSVGIDVYNRFFVRQQEIIMDRFAAQVDPFIIQAANGGGLYMRFDGFDGRLAGYTTNFYFRGNYILYPQRVLVADPSVAINTPDQILAANSDYSDQWLINHDVPTELTYIMRRDPNGGLPSLGMQLHSTTKPSQ